MSFRRLRFWLITPFAVLLFIILLLLAVVFFLSATKSGTSTLINLASRSLPDLRMEGANGSLLNNLELQRIVWESDGVNIEVSDAELKLSSFLPIFTIEKLVAKRITLSLPEQEDAQERKPFELVLPDIHIPVDVELMHIVVDELDIKQGDALIRLRDVRLNALIKNDTLKLRNLYGDLYDDDGNIVVAAKGEMGLSSPHPIALGITVNGDSTRLGVGSLKLKAMGEVADYNLTSSGHWKYADYPKYNLNFEGKGNLEYLDVDTFHLQGDAGDVDLNGRMSWSPELNWALEVRGDNLNPGAFVADYSGQLNMVWVTTGSLTDKVSLQLELKELTGKLQDYPIDAQMQLSIEDQAITLKNLDAKVGDNRLTAQGDADKTLAINWQLDAPKLGQLHESINGHLKGKGQLSGVRDGSQFSVFIEQLSGKILDYPLQAEGGLRLDGELVSADNLQLNVGVNEIRLNGSADELQGIDWQIDAKKLSQLYPELKGKLSGKGNVKGLLDGSRAELEIESLQGKVQDFSINASGNVKLEDQIVSVNELLLEVGKNQLVLNGSTGKGLSEDLGVDWVINAKNLKQLYPDIKGNVKGSGQLSGVLDGSAFKLKIAELVGKIEGRPLNIKGEIHSESGKLSLQELTILAGKNRLNANGLASEPFDLTWDIDASKLSQVWSGLGGKLKGKGTLSGNLDQLQIQADLVGKKLRYEDLRIGSLDLKVDQKGDIYTIKADIKKLKQGENIIQSVAIKGKGKLEDHTADLAIAHKDGKLELKAAGGWKNEQWQGTLKKLALRDTPEGNWRLRNPVAINASAKVVNASKICLANNKNAQICADAEWSEEQGVRAKGNLKKIPLKMATPWLPDNLSLAGLANADFDFSQKNGKPIGKVDLRLPDSSFTITNEKGRKETLRYSNALANVSIKNKKAKLKASIDLKNRGQLRADGSIDLADNDKKSRINAKVKLTVPDIHWVQQFSNDIDELKGKLEGDVSITGTIGKPRVTGSAKLQNASVFLPETGARLQAINLTMQANRADQIAITGSLKAGQGLLNTKGNLYLANLPKWKADLKLSGERLLLMDTHEVQAFVSPNLSIKATPDSIAINGTVKIPETTITLRELPVSAKARSDDIVIIGRGNKSGKGAAIRASDKDDSPLDIKPNIVVELGNKVSFTGFGLDARLTGKLRVLRTRQDIVAQGALNVVDGTYEAYGQVLEIERGRLIFDGPVDNPGLDVRVIRDIAGDDITVGIALRGTAQNPESELFSTPPQTQTDTLSYLLTGQSVSSVGSGDTAMLTQAVTGLGIKGGEGLAQQLGSELGLDEVGINTKGGDYKSSELTLGKRIGSKLYIKYIVGLFDSLQKVAVTYQINKRLQLNAKTGVQQEVDMKYKFDTDRGLFGR